MRRTVLGDRVSNRSRFKQWPQTHEPRVTRGWRRLDQQPQRIPARPSGVPRLLDVAELAEIPLKFRRHTGWRRALPSRLQASERLRQRTLERLPCSRSRPVSALERVRCELIDLAFARVAPDQLPGPTHQRDEIAIVALAEVADRERVSERLCENVLAAAPPRGSSPRRRE